MNIKELVTGICITAIFTFIYFYFIPIGIKVPSSVRLPMNSPAFFPKVITLLLVGLGLVLIVQNVIPYLKEGRQAIEKKEQNEDLISPHISIIKVLSAIVALFLYYEAIKIVGILIASILFFILFSTLYGDKRFKIILPLALILPIALSYFFTNVAHVPLPQGVFE